MVRYGHYSLSQTGSFHEKPQEKKDWGARGQGKQPRLEFKLNKCTPCMHPTIEEAVNGIGGLPPGLKTRWTPADLCFKTEIFLAKFS
jgi:hypothetical protein